MIKTFIPSLVNIFRSVFHVSLFVMGLVYAFTQPAFLNAEVWVFMYSLAGAALAFDALIFIFPNHFKAWPIIHFCDALLVAFIIYLTGYTFFGFLSFIWLMHILFAGLQFQYKGSLLQGLWTSCLFTWVHFISPHFASVDGTFFALNNFIFLLMAFSAGFMGVYFQPWLSSFRHLYWNVKRSFTHPLRRFRWDAFLEDTEDSDVHQEKLNINELIGEVVEYIHSKTKFQSIQCELSEVSVIFGYKSKLKQVMISLIQWFFHTYSDFQKLKITTYNDGTWAVIQLEKLGVAQVKEPLQVFNWLKGFSVIQKVIDEHGGQIEVSDKTNSLYIKLPNGEETTQQVS
ncbi:MAG: hypothetical protein OXK80_06310 [Bdellovibrionales bacterium]|nr:hypothetical protein [Bdellovibrionales bacterium]